MSERINTQPQEHEQAKTKIAKDFVRIFKKPNSVGAIILVKNDGIKKFKFKGFDAGKKLFTIEDIEETKDVEMSENEFEVFFRKSKLVTVDSTEEELMDKTFKFENEAELPPTIKKFIEKEKADIDVKIEAEKEKGEEDKDSILMISFLQKTKKLLQDNPLEYFKKKRGKIENKLSYVNDRVVKDYWTEQENMDKLNWVIHKLEIVLGTPKTEAAIVLEPIESRIKVEKTRETLLKKIETGIKKQVQEKSKRIQVGFNSGTEKFNNWVTGQREETKKALTEGSLMRGSAKKLLLAAVFALGILGVKEIIDNKKGNENTAIARGLSSTPAATATPGTQAPSGFANVEPTPAPIVEVTPAIAEKPDSKPLTAESDTVTSATPVETPTPRPDTEISTPKEILVPKKDERIYVADLEEQIYGRQGETTEVQSNPETTPNKDNKPLEPITETPAVTEPVSEPEITPKNIVPINDSKLLEEVLGEIQRGQQTPEEFLKEKIEGRGGTQEPFMVNTPEVKPTSIDTPAPETQKTEKESVDEIKKGEILQKTTDVNRVTENLTAKKSIEIKEGVNPALDKEILEMEKREFAGKNPFHLNEEGLTQAYKVFNEDIEFLFGDDWEKLKKLKTKNIIGATEKGNGDQNVTRLEKWFRIIGVKQPKTSWFRRDKKVEECAIEAFQENAKNGTLGLIQSNTRTEFRYQGRN